MFLIKYSFFFLLLSFANMSFAKSPSANMLSDYVYIFELIVIAIVALALIMLTISIAKSRRRISDMVKEIRGEMNEERTVFAMTVKSIKEKEKQVSYMAHLLQTHLESGSNNANDGKKKAISDEMVVEILDDVINDAEQSDDHSKPDSSLGNTSRDQQNRESLLKSSVTESSVSQSSVPPPLHSQQTLQTNQPSSYPNSHSSSQANHHQTVDPRMVAADGTVKQAHFGPDQYLADISNFQRQAYQRVQGSVKQADQHLANMLHEITNEMEFVKAERANLKDFIFAINSNIRKEDPQKMNSRDRKIVQKLSSIDSHLKALEESHFEIDACYKDTMTVLNKYAGSLSNETVSDAIEEAVTTPA